MFRSQLSTRHAWDSFWCFSRKQSGFYYMQSVANSPLRWILFLKTLMSFCRIFVVPLNIYWWHPLKMWLESVQHSSAFTYESYHDNKSELRLTISPWASNLYRSSFSLCSHRSLSAAWSFSNLLLNLFQWLTVLIQPSDLSTVRICCHCSNTLPQWRSTNNWTHDLVSNWSMFWPILTKTTPQLYCFLKKKHALFKKKMGTGKKKGKLHIW